MYLSLSPESRRAHPPPSLNVNKGVKLLSGSCLWFMREMFALVLWKFSILQDKTQPSLYHNRTRKISSGGLRRLSSAKLASCGGSPREFLHLWQLANASVLAHGGLWEFNAWMFSRSPPVPKITTNLATPLTVPWKQLELRGEDAGRCGGKLFSTCDLGREERGGFITPAGCNDREEMGRTCWVIVP